MINPPIFTEPDICPNCGHALTAHNPLMGTCEENEVPDEVYARFFAVDEYGNEEEWVYLEDIDGPMLMTECATEIQELFRGRDNQMRCIECQEVLCDECMECHNKECPQYCLCDAM